MDLHVSLDGPGDRATRIYLTVREAVLEGRLAADDRLPASRDLARQLGVARGTVTVAYDRLAAEGFLESRPGSGTYITSVALAPDEGRRARHGAVRPLALWEHRDVEPPPRARRLHDLGIGLPDPTLFPLEVWRRLVGDQLRRSRLADATYGGRGSWRLRDEIARFLGLSRSVAATGDDVVVTVGAQQAVDLVCRVLVEPGTVVAVEDPGYAAMHRLLESHRADLRGVPVDAEGLVVQALPADARLVYVTPSHQFPTGVLLSMRRRAALLQWAAEHDAVVVEDDYDSDFRWSDRPLEPLQSLDRDGRVVYVGTFSKSLLPGLRVGFLVAPRSLRGALAEAKRVTTWEGDLTTQGALAELLAEGHHAAHVRRAAKHYRPRRAALLEGLGRLDEVLEVVPSVAGLHVSARFRDPHTDDFAVVRRAAALGVRVEALSAYHLQQPVRPGLALGFAGVAPDAVPDALARLGAAIRDQA